MLSRVKMIAEPWDIGPNGYQVGNFPPGWAEWNGRYRDDDAQLLEGRRRRCCRPSRAACSARPTSSSSRAASPGRASTSSPRMTASRSPTSASYNDKHNEANGEDNRDGHDDNRSWNCGVEGPTDDPGDPRPARPHAPQPDGDAAALAGHADAADGRRGRPHAERQQQRLLPGQRDRLARMEGHQRPRPRLHGVRARRDPRSRKRYRCCARTASCTARRSTSKGTRNVVWYRPDGREMDAGVLDRPERQGGRPAALRRRRRGC